MGRRQIATAVEMLLDHASIALQEPDVVAAAVGQFRKARAVDFSDCLILETARRAGRKPLGTFDKTLANLEDAKRL